MHIVDSSHCLLNVAIMTWELTSMPSCDIEIATFLAAIVHREVAMFMFSQLWGSPLRCRRRGRHGVPFIADVFDVCDVICC